MFGLDEKALQAIRGVLEKYVEIDETKVFGSRALGTQRPNSDIDLVLSGKTLNATIVGKVRSDLEELPLPYKFDVIAYHLIEHADLKDHIDRVGKSLFRRAL